MGHVPRAREGQSGGLEGTQTTTDSAACNQEGSTAMTDAHHGGAHAPPEQLPDLSLCLSPGPGSAKQEQGFLSRVGVSLRPPGGGGSLFQPKKPAGWQSWLAARAYINQKGLMGGVPGWEKGRWLAPRGCGKYLWFQTNCTTS